VLETLLWASYVMGMELPGRDALFSKFTIRFESARRQSSRLQYSLALRSFDLRIGQMRAAFDIRASAKALASGECWSFVRPALKAEPEELPQSEALAGRVALLVGASRGLGAALRRALQSQGAAVIGVSRSLDSADGDIVAGDASKLETLERVRERIVREHGRLDYLICNACPSILPLRLEPSALARVEDYVARSLSLVAAPLAAFLDLLNRSGGCTIAISSSAVEQPVREWPHYIAAKNAVEGLVRVAPLQYPQTSALIVRPEKLLTDMTNTPLGRRGAVPPIEFALRVLQRLQQPFQPGTSEIFR
jgi:NAD(P)-dependent dehydrogenase (short-subunit alcohol dehydrogenase family)